jgi:hypothetical protein
MFKALFRRHRGLAVAASLLGVVALVAGMAGPAAAAGSDTGPTGGNNASGNYNIYQGGSNTTYLMMNGLAALFNESPGCDLSSAASQQPLDYGCPGVNDLGGSLSSSNNPANPISSSNIAVGENGFSPFATENPFNDILIEEPPIGSGNGIKELEEQNTHAPATTFTIPDVTVTASSATITATGTGGSIFPSSLGTGTWYVTGADQEIPSGATVATYTSSTSLTLSSATSAFTPSPDVVSVTFSSSTSGANVAPLDSARSSRAPNLTAGSSAGDDKGLNFVAYAMDGVSWLHWTAAPVGTSAPAATPSAGVTNLSVAQLASIFNGTLTCTVDSVTFNMNWGCLPGGPTLTASSSTTPDIVVYWAQNGSGTEATWANLLYGTSNAPTSYYPSLTANHVIFENETESIVDNGDEADAIFFFSYGKYNTVCTPTSGYCGAEPTSWAAGSSLALGQIAGSTVDQASIASQLPGGTTATVVSDAEVQPGGTGTKAIKVSSGSFPAAVLVGDTVSDSGGCIPTGDTVSSVKSATKLKVAVVPTCSSSSDTVTFTPPAPFPGDRLLYNVYSDGSDPDIAASSDAALNVVSEDGFVCKPSTATDVDPNTGAFYRTEIDSVITSNGFYPLPLGVETGTYTAPSGNGGPYNSGSTSYTNPAWTALSNSAYDNTTETGQPYNFPAADTDTDDSAVSGSYSINGTSHTATQDDPIGYCLVLTTDGNSTN